MIHRSLTLKLCLICNHSRILHFNLLVSLIKILHFGPIVLLICLFLMVWVKNRRINSYLRNLRILRIIRIRFEIIQSIIVLINLGYATKSRFTTSIIMPSTILYWGFITWIWLKNIFLFLCHVCWWPIIDIWLFRRHGIVCILWRSKRRANFFVALFHIRILVLVLERCWVLLFEVRLAFKTLAHVVLLKVQLLGIHIEVVNLVTWLDKCWVNFYKRRRQILHENLIFLCLGRLK